MKTFILAMIVSCCLFAHLAQAQSPTAFSLPQHNGYSRWTMTGPSTWQETYADGNAPNHFRVVSKTKLQGISGTIVRRTDGLELFLPNLSTGSSWVGLRNSPTSSWVARWQQMTNASSKPLKVSSTSRTTQSKSSTSTTGSTNSLSFPYRGIWSAKDDGAGYGAFQLQYTRGTPPTYSINGSAERGRWNTQNGALTLETRYTYNETYQMRYKQVKGEWVYSALNLGKQYSIVKYRFIPRSSGRVLQVERTSKTYTPIATLNRFKQPLKVQREVGMFRFKETLIIPGIYVDNGEKKVSTGETRTFVLQNQFLE